MNNNSQYNFEYADVSVYACAVKLIADYAIPGHIHLDLGCGYAAIASKVNQLGMRYIGFDANADTVAALREKGIEAYLIDLRSPETALEVILAACGDTALTTISMLDVIEHLDFECRFLEVLRCALPTANTLTLIASIPNFSHTDVATKLFAGSWEYTPSGLLDNTHTVIYTEAHLTQTLRARGWYEVNRADYRQEYSDQYFIRPAVVLNRYDGIGAHLRQLKQLLDKNADVHQFVRAYQINPVDTVLLDTPTPPTLLSVRVCDAAALEAVTIALAALENAEQAALVEIVLPDQVGADHPLMQGRFWGMCSVAALPTRDYFKVLLPALANLNDAAVLYITPEIAEVNANLYLDSAAIVALIKTPCTALLVPRDYAVQFQDYPSKLSEPHAWQRYCLHAALRAGVKRLSTQSAVMLSTDLPVNTPLDAATAALVADSAFMFLNGISVAQRQQQEFQAQEREQQQRFDALQAQFTAMTHSLSWRLTSPLRQVKRVIPLCRKWSKMNWLTFDTWRLFFRALVAKAPVLRVLRQKYLHWKFLVLASPKMLGHSSDNLPALQALSLRRFTPRAKSVANVLSLAQLPDIDVSVVAYNSSRWVKPFIASLMTQQYPLAKIHLRVVDHGSHDDTVQQFEDLLLQQSLGFASVVLIQQENLGFGAGHDRAIKAGCADYCLVTNLDLEFLSDSLVQVVSAALNDTAGAVASWEMRQMPFEHPKYYDPVTLETNWSSHACILMRRSAYQQVGGYDAGIFMYAEDVELSYRFRSHGYALKYVPKATVKHFTYESAGQIKPLQFAGSAIGNVYIRLRYGKAIDRLLGVVLYSALLLKPAPFAGAKSLLLQRGGALLRQLPHFLHGKGKVPAYFPLIGFDYEMIREGAFWEIPPPLSGDCAPLVSIITRTYRGRGVFLAQAMHSVFNQTYPHIELLVVEDGGANQQALVTELAENAPAGCRVQFIACEKLGRSGAGNKALAATTGRFVMFLDDDDLLFADHVETLVTVLQREPALSAAYALAFEVLTDIQTDYTGYRETSFYTPEIFKQAWRYEVLADHNFIPIQAILFKRELYEARGGFDVTLDQLEDWNLWMRYGYGKQFAYVPKTTSLFRSPADFETRSSRHALLHDAYDLAKNKAMASLQELRV